MDAGIIDQARRKLNADFTLEELLNAKNRMRKHKGGSDGVVFEFFRGERVPGSIGNHTNSLIHNMLLTLLNNVLRLGKYPEAWRLATLIPLVKPGTKNPQCPSNYKGIALLSTLSKLFSNLVEKRLNDFMWVVKRIAPEQFGFTCGRRSLDPCLILDIR